MCKLEQIQSVGRYSERAYGDAWYSIDTDGNEEDVISSEHTEADDYEYDHDHYVCPGHEEFSAFDCTGSDGDSEENDEGKPRVDGARCCVVCHTWNDYRAITAKDREYRAQRRREQRCAIGEHDLAADKCKDCGWEKPKAVVKPKPEYNLTPDALAVIEQMLKGEVK